MSRSDRGGFTLLEVVAALAIVALAAVGAMDATGEGLRMTGRLRQFLYADALAEQRLSAVSLMSAKELNAMPDSSALGEASADGTVFQWQVTVQPVLERQGLYDAAVRVEWQGHEHWLRSRLYRTGVGPS